MATAKPTKDKIKIAEDLDVWDYGSVAMRRYGEEVNESRAIAALQDGLKPVARRLLWAARGMNSQGKSARLVGSTMGLFHPHGDASIYGALTTAVNSPVPPFMGIGNWGSMIDGPAAMRYTEVKLSTYGKQFLVSDYVAVTPFTPNYDDKEEEPVYLPALLPNLFMNDSLGVGYGVQAGFPAFTPTSLLPVLIRMLGKEKIPPKELAKDLVLYEPWGGIPVPTKTNRLAIQALMESEGSTIAYHSPLELEKDAKRITVSKFAPQLNHDKFLAACRAIPQVKTVTAGKGLSYIIQVHANVNMNEFEKVCARVQALSQTKMSYKLYVSDRSLKEGTESGEVDIQFMSGSVPQLLVRWLSFRVKLEKDCIQHRIAETEKVIKRLKLMIHAANNLDVIFKALRTTTPAKHISEGMKVSMDDARVILALQVRKLSKLDQNVIKEKLQAMQQRKATLEGQLKAPSKNVKRYFENCLELFLQRAREEGSKSACQHWWLRRNPVTDDTQQLLEAGTQEAETESA